jgi:hypothetical protein
MKTSIATIKIPAGSDTGSTVIMLEPGTAKKLSLFTHGTQPTEGVDIKIETIRGDEILQYVPHQELKPRGGDSHWNSNKDLTISGNQQIKVFAKSTGVLAAPFTLRTIFYHPETDL